MKWVARVASSVSGGLVRNRDKLPRIVNRIIDDVAKNPDGAAGRLASILLGGRSSAHVPAATSVPPTEVRVYIGPTNYSGQGYLWAKALERSSPRIGARNMAVELPGGFAFPADSIVPVAVYNRSDQWQQRELEAVSEFTHVLIEAERPLFGSLFGRDVSQEISALQSRGLSVAFLAHGTDIRSPRRHMERTPWSYFSDDREQTALLQADADRNRELISSADLPVFVSTPDLLLDLPEAHWCPVVVDPEAWTGARELLSVDTPVVAHIPSASGTKGSALIEPHLRALEQRGVLRYSTVSGIRASEMPKRIGEADIVLDQFRAGSYGVAACEAMAAGRVVVGHVFPEVRDLIADRTGLQLPIVEATPDTIGEVIERLVDDRDLLLRLGEDGRSFVRDVHSGDNSARALREQWIDVPS